MGETVKIDTRKKTFKTQMDNIAFRFEGNERYWSSSDCNFALDRRIAEHTKYLKENYKDKKQFFGMFSMHYLLEARRILSGFEMMGLMNETLSGFSKDLEEVLVYFKK